MFASLLILSQVKSLMSLYFNLFGSSGGVVLASQDGKIVCENTLDARLEVVYRQKLPEVCTLVPVYIISVTGDIPSFSYSSCLLALQLKN